MGSADGVSIYSKEGRNYAPGDAMVDQEKKEGEYVVGSTTHCLIVMDEKKEERREEQEMAMDHYEDDDSDDVNETVESKPYIDKGYAWVIAFASFCTQFLMTGYMRSAGVIFVEIQNQFDSSASLTSLINGIQEGMFSIVSFVLVGFVLQKTSPRFICLIGSACLAVGVAGNYVATNAEFLIFSQGVCAGSALGSAYGASLIVISHFFVKQRALATSIVSAGVSAGGTAMPIFIRYMLDNYGFHGGFLILGAFVSHTFVSSLLLIPIQNFERLHNRSKFSSDETDEDKVGKDVKKEGEGEIQCYKLRLGLGENDLDNESFCDVNGPDPAQEGGKLDVLEADYNFLRSVINGSHLDKSLDIVNPLVESQYHNTFIPKKKKNQSMSTSTEKLSLQVLNFKQRQISSLSVNKNDVSMSLLDTPTKRSMSQFSLMFQSASTHPSIADLSSLADVFGKRDNPATPDKQKRKDVCSHPLTRSATFWVLPVFFVLSWIGHLVPLTYVPVLAKEKGMSDDDGAFFVSILNILDFFARLVPGVIVNTGYMKVNTICIVPMTAVGIVGYLTPMINSYGSLLALVITYGLCTGVFISMQTLIIIEMVGLKHFPFVLACNYLAMSLGTTIFFPVVGLLKDSTGSYTTPYYCLATFELLAVVIMVFLPAVKRLDVRRGVLE